MAISLSTAATEWLQDQVNAREARIAEIVKADSCPRFMAALKHDCEFAPETTQGAVLTSLGLRPSLHAVTPPEASDGDVRAEIGRITEGLAFIGTFISGTNHLTDRELLNYLETRILTEVIRFVPPTPDMNEFLDMTNCPNGEGITGDDTDTWPVSDRDDTLPKPVRPSENGLELTET